MFDIRDHGGNFVGSKYKDGNEYLSGEDFSVSEFGGDVVSVKSVDGSNNHVGFIKSGDYIITYLPSDYKFYKFDLDLTKVSSSLSVPNQLVNTDHFQLSNDGQFIFACDTSNLYKLKISDLSFTSVSVESSSLANSSFTLTENNQIIIVTYANATSTKGNILIYDASTLELLRTNTTSVYNNRYIVSGDGKYLVYDKNGTPTTLLPNTMEVYDAYTHELLWTRADTLVYDPKVIDMFDGKVFFLSNTDRYVLDSETGSTILIEPLYDTTRYYPFYFSRTINVHNGYKMLVYTIQSCFVLVLFSKDFSKILWEKMTTIYNGNSLINSMIPLDSNNFYIISGTSVYKLKQQTIIKLGGVK